MAKFKVTLTRHVLRYFMQEGTYTIEAENEDEALQVAEDNSWGEDSAFDAIKTFDGPEEVKKALYDVYDECTRDHDLDLKVEKIK